MRGAHRYRRGWRPRRPPRTAQAGAALALFLAAVLAAASNFFADWPPRTSDAGAAITADRLVGTARVIDGDTLTIAGERIRLWGIDSPERDQVCVGGSPGGRASTALTRAIDGATVSCRIRDHDDYGRAVAICEADGADLGAAQVASGWAWDYRRFSGGRYRTQEADARDHNRGVWALECAPAWEWRTAQRDRS